MSNLYYGIGPVPKGMKQATESQAFKNKMVNKYGEIQADPQRMRKAKAYYMYKDMKEIQEIQARNEAKKPAYEENKKKMLEMFAEHDRLKKLAEAEKKPQTTEAQKKMPAEARKKLLQMWEDKKMIERMNEASKKKSVKVMKKASQNFDLWEKQIAKDKKNNIVSYIETEYKQAKLSKEEEQRAKNNAGVYLQPQNIKLIGPEILYTRMNRIQQKKYNALNENSDLYIIEHRPMPFQYYRDHWHRQYYLVFEIVNEQNFKRDYIDFFSNKAKGKKIEFNKKEDFIDGKTVTDETEIFTKIIYGKDKKIYFAVYIPLQNAINEAKKIIAVPKGTTLIKAQVEDIEKDDEGEVNIEKSKLIKNYNNSVI